MTHLPFCPFCLSANSCRVGFTKKSRPFLVCRLCYTRAFIQNRDALRGVAVIPGMLAGLLSDQVGRQRVRQQHAALLAEMDRYLSGPSVEEPRAAALPELPQIVPYEEVA